MHDHAGRPHWGKSFERNSAELFALYPEHGRFDVIRRGLDPHGVFRNRFVDRIFGSQTSSRR
jgi:hypothetical protein